MRNWITDRLPEDGETVVMRIDDRDLPIDLGYRSQGKWRTLRGGICRARYIDGWMSLKDAARLLDDSPPQKGQ